MATRGEWTKYITAEHTLALVESDLRELVRDQTKYDASTEAARILFERFA